MSDRPINVLGISGSLRLGSYNTALLEAARRHFPAGTNYVVRLIRDIPVYDPALDGETKPHPVEELRAAVLAADAVLIATPEYNYSLPGGLKNAIDWISRPGFKSPLAHQPVGVLSASRGQAGGARAQAHLKQILLSTLSAIYPAPEFAVGDAASKFDADGRLTDVATDEKLARYIGGFADWVAGRS